jgi:hypothetical protein
MVGITLIAEVGGILLFSLFETGHSGLNHLNHGLIILLLKISDFIFMLEKPLHLCNFS